MSLAALDAKIEALFDLHMARIGSPTQSIILDIAKNIRLLTDSVIEIREELRSLRATAEKL